MPKVSIAFKIFISSTPVHIFRANITESNILIISFFQSTPRFWTDKGQHAFWIFVIFQRAIDYFVCHNVAVTSRWSCGSIMPNSIVETMKVSLGQKETPKSLKVYKIVSKKLLKCCGNLPRLLGSYLCYP